MVVMISSIGCLMLLFMVVMGMLGMYINDRVNITIMTAFNHLSISINQSISRTRAG